MPTSVRYIVDSTEDLSFYELLGFEVIMHPAPAFAMLGRDDTRLLLSVPGGSGGGGQAVGDRAPEPGGWNRLQIVVDSLDDTVARLTEAGVRFRGEPVTGIGGRQAIVEDASGNPFELFEPASEST